MAYAATQREHLDRILRPEPHWMKRFYLTSFMTVVIRQRQLANGIWEMRLNIFQQAEASIRIWEFHTA
jgi:hypothetical protein